MKVYDVYYRERGNKEATVFATTVSYQNKKEAMQAVREELGNEYTVLAAGRVR